MSKKEPNLIAKYNEYRFIKEVFSFTPSIRKLLYCYMFIQNRRNQIILLALKHLLLVEKHDPVEVEKIIRKWCVVVIYYFAKTMYGYKETSTELDNLLSKDLTFKSLDECNVLSNEIIGNVFNATDEINKNYNKKITEFCQSLSSVLLDFDKHNLCTADVNNLLTNDNYFFTNHNGKVESFKNAFTRYANNKSFDRLISEALNSDLPISFEIEFTYEEFKKCVKNYRLDPKKEDVKISSLHKKNIPLIFGYMVAMIIEEENYNLSNNLTYLKIEQLLVNQGQQKCNIDIDGFIPQEKDGINVSKIITCEFLLNGAKYQFSSTGLKKI